MDEDRWMKYGDIITLQFACSNENAGKGSVGFVSSDGFIAPDLWVHTLTESGNMPPNLHNCCFEITRPFKYTAFKVLQKKLRSQGKTFNSLNDKVLPPTAAARYTESSSDCATRSCSMHSINKASLRVSPDCSFHPLDRDSTSGLTLDISSLSHPLVISLTLSRSHCRTHPVSPSTLFILMLSHSCGRCLTHAVSVSTDCVHPSSIYFSSRCSVVSFQHTDSIDTNSIVTGSST